MVGDEGGYSARRGDYSLNAKGNFSFERLLRYR